MTTKEKVDYSKYLIDQNYVPGTGNPKAKIFICGDYARQMDRQNGEPFSASSGQMLREMLSIARVDHNDLYYTNVLKHVVPYDNPHIAWNTLKADHGSSVKQIAKEIDAINPNVIFALGDIAISVLAGVKGIINYRGSILRCQYGNGKKIVAGIHPARFFLGRSEPPLPWNWKAFCQLDYNKVGRESQTPKIHLPERLLTIARHSIDVYRFFFEENKGVTRYASDIETYKSIPTCISFAPSPNRAISIPLVNIPGIDPIVLTDGDLSEIHRIVNYALKTYEIIGQNWRFDRERLEGTWGHPTRNWYADTQIMASITYPEFPKSLAFQASILTNEPYYKVEGKEFDPSKDPVSRLLFYNARDSAVGYDVFQQQDIELEEIGCKPFYYEFMKPLQELYYQMESRGIRFDFEKRLVLRAKYEKIEERLSNQLKELNDGNSVNINSPKQIRAFLFSKLGLPERESTDEDTIFALIGNNAKTDKQLQALICTTESRRTKKALSTYINAEPDYDGRMRSTLNLAGTETGRTNSGKYDSPTRPESLGWAFQTLTKHGEFGREIRSLLIPDEGMIFITPDLSQAEARVVALLAEDYDLLKLFDTVDVHRLRASWFFGISDWRTIPKKTPDGGEEPRRFVGKTISHGGGYDMHKHRGMTEVNTRAAKFHIGCTPLESGGCNLDHYKISEITAGKMFDTFHRFTPKIRDIFHHGICDQLRKDQTLVNPYGRKRTFYGRLDRGTEREGFAYIPQSTVGDKLKSSMLEINKRAPWVEFLLEGHDAFLAQVPIKRKDEAAILFKEVLETPIDFSRCSLPRGKLVIPCDIEVGMNYFDLKKWEIGK